MLVIWSLHHTFSPLGKRDGKMINLLLEYWRNMLVGWLKSHQQYLNILHLENLKKIFIAQNISILKSPWFLVLTHARCDEMYCYLFLFQIINPVTAAIIKTIITMTTTADTVPIDDPLVPRWPTTTGDLKNNIVIKNGYSFQVSFYNESQTVENVLILCSLIAESESFYHLYFINYYLCRTASCWCDREGFSCGQWILWGWLNGMVFRRRSWWNYAYGTLRRHNKCQILHGKKGIKE
jgi:hypothetical protein